MGFGTNELILVIVVIAVLFGTKQLPKLFRSASRREQQVATDLLLFTLLVGMVVVFCLQPILRHWLL